MTARTERFALGEVVVTQGVKARFDGDNRDWKNVVHAMIARHMKGDWGDLGEEDKKSNEEAVLFGQDMILSVYHVTTSDEEIVKVNVLTEWDRSVTTVHLPEER